MFNFGKENLGGHEQSEQLRNATEKIAKAIGSCCDGEIDKRLKNNQDISL